MTDEEHVTLQVPVSLQTHQRLSVLAARLRIPKTEIYTQALRWASTQKGFKDALAKVYTKAR